MLCFYSVSKLYFLLLLLNQNNATAVQNKNTHDFFPAFANIRFTNSFCCLRQDITQLLHFSEIMM